MRWKIGLILGIVVLLVLVLIGWRLAPRIDGIEPFAENLHGQQPFAINFSQPMYEETVDSWFDMDPSQPGDYSWNEEGTRLTFTPSRSWPAGKTITLRMVGKPRSRIRLPLLGQFAVELTVSPILMTYLWPADEVSNLYLVNPVNGESRALTKEANGVLDYSISANGEQIYFSSSSASGTSNIKVINRTTETSGLITSCDDGLCTSPRISPDGQLLAYEYIPREPGHLPTIKVLDIEEMTLIDFGETDQYLEKPLWSPSGWLAYYNQTEKAYQFWNPMTGEKKVLPNETGGDGSWSPDGRYFVCSEILFLSDTLAPRHLQLYDLRENTLLDLSRGSYPEDLNPSFAPSGMRLAYSHKSLAPSLWTPGRELWVLNINNGDNIQLSEVIDYQHTSFAWHPDGNILAYVRYNQAALSDPPEIWLMDVNSGEPLRLIINGFQPGWVP